MYSLLLFIPPNISSPIEAFEFRVDATGEITFGVTTSSGVAAWWVDGTIYTSNSVTHNFGGVAGTKTVRLLNTAALLDKVTAIDVSSCAVTGFTYLPAFTALTTFTADTNTGLVFDLVNIPATWTALTTLAVNGTGVSCTGFLAALTAIQSIAAQDCAWTASECDALLSVLYANRASYTFATPTLNIGGTNAAPTGYYIHTVPPTSGEEYAYSLEYDPDSDGFNQWTITLNLNYSVGAVIGAALKAAYSSIYSDMYVESTGPGGTVVSDGSPIGWIEDLSGNSQHLAQATTANKATYDASHASFGNQPVMGFDGGDYYQKAFGATYVQPNTIIAIGRVNSTATSQFYVDGFDSTHRHWFRNSSALYWYYGAGNNCWHNVAPDANLHIFIIIYNEATSKFYRDGGVPSSQSVGTHTLTGATIGAIYNLYNQLLGQISEITVINAAATLSQINQILNFYSKLYGVAITPVT